MFLIDEHKDDTESSVTLQTEHPTNVEINPQQKQFNYKNKYCSACNHEFSHRSGYLRHIKNIHKGRIPTTSDNDNPPEVLLIIKLKISTIHSVLIS
jgi:hypothetical protein